MLSCVKHELQHPRELVGNGTGAEASPLQQARLSTSPFARRSATHAD